MYGKCKYNANLQSDKKSLILHKLVWCIFKWGGEVDYRLFFSEITYLIIRSKKVKVANTRLPNVGFRS